MREVLIAIHPEWVQQIYAGLKCAELRKTLPKLPFKVRFLETGGERLITGEAECWGAIAYAPRMHTDVFEGIRRDANVTAEQLFRYAGDGAIFAWYLQNVRRYARPIRYQGKSPQSWQYLPFAEDKSALPLALRKAELCQQHRTSISRR